MSACLCGTACVFEQALEYARRYPAAARTMMHVDRMKARRGSAIPWLLLACVFFIALVVTGLVVLGPSYDRGSFKMPGIQR